MKKTLFIVALIIMIGVYLNTLSSKNVEALVSNTAVAYMSTSTIVTVGPATSTNALPVKYNCASRVVSTKGQAVMIGFSSTTPTATRGFWQAASSTVTYSGDRFGCGSLNIYGLVGSTTIDVAEFLF